MKRMYNKPELRTIKLIASESLLSASLILNETKTIDGGTEGGILSNKESEHDIWGNDGSSMW